MAVLLQLQASADDTYSIEQHRELAGFAVELNTKKTGAMKTRCFVTLTSPLLRQSECSSGASL